MSPAAQNPGTIVNQVIAGWLVPGLGHILAGFPRRGVILLILIGGTFISGGFLSRWEAVSRSLHPYAFWAQVGVGGGVLPLLAINPTKGEALPVSESIQSYQTLPRNADTGVLFCSIAGLLNMLVLFDLVERTTGSRREEATT